MHAVPLVHNDYFTGEFLPKFDLKNMISTYAKDFSWENLPKQCKMQLLRSSSGQ
jgi:hypothetical protein